MQRIWLIAGVVLICSAWSGCGGQSGRAAKEQRTATPIENVAAPGAGSVWRLTGAGPPGVLALKTETMTGKDGCNGYQASWKQGGDGVRFSNFSGTTAACQGRVVTALQRTRKWFVKRDRLILLDRRGHQLVVFRADR